MKKFIWVPFALILAGLLFLKGNGPAPKTLKNIAFIPQTSDCIVKEKPSGEREAVCHEILGEK